MGQFPKVHRIRIANLTINNSTKRKHSLLQIVPRQHQTDREMGEDVVLVLSFEARRVELGGAPVGLDRVVCSWRGHGATGCTAATSTAVVVTTTSTANAINYVTRQILLEYKNSSDYKKAENECAA